MPRNNLHKAFFVLFEVAVIFLCVMGIKQSAEKATIYSSDTVEPDTRSGTITVSRNTDSLQEGDQLLAIDGTELHHFYDVEFVLDGMQIGERVEIGVSRNGNRLVVHETLKGYYSTVDILSQLLAAAACLLIGLLVLTNRPTDPVAIRFKHLTAAVACLVCFTAGYYKTEPEGIGYLLRFLFPSLYLLTGVLLCDFCLRYTTRSHPPKWITLFVLYSLPTLGLVIGTIFAVQALNSDNLADAVPYYTVLSLFKGMLILLAALAVGYVRWTFVRTSDRVERRRLMWVLGSVGFSVGWYVFFWQIPTSLFVKNTLPTEYHFLLKMMTFPESSMLLALVLSCIGLAIGIVRYRLFDIEVLSRRGITTFVVVTSLLMLYWVAMYVLTTSFAEADNTTLISASTLVTALLLFALIPIRKLTQHFVDKWVFQLEYDYRETEAKLLQTMGQSLNADSVGGVLVDDLAALLKIERSVLLLRNVDDRFTLARGRGINKRQSSFIVVNADRIRNLNGGGLYDFGGFCEPGMDVTNLDLPAARRLGFALLATLSDSEGYVIGMLVFGRKSGLAPFSLEDLALIDILTGRAAIQLNRIRLQERLTLEVHESNRLRELNRMKSHFVSGVSHDLKTPLTAIRMYTEMISMRSVAADTDTSRYLSVIDGECRRLSRLIDNVLDFSRIEQGKRHYRLVTVDLVEIVQDTINAMQYQFDISAFECELHLKCTACRVSADPAAIQDALINLVSNAIKYSDQEKRIDVEVKRDNYGACVSVRDYGPGISSDDMPHLFEPFYRSPNEHTQRQGGVGLGLSLIRHIMTGHNGAVEVESVPGRGSSFSLILPIQEAA